MLGKTFKLETKISSYSKLYHHSMGDNIKQNVCGWITDAKGLEFHTILFKSVNLDLDQKKLKRYIRQLHSKHVKALTSVQLHMISMGGSGKSSAVKKILSLLEKEKHCKDAATKMQKDNSRHDPSTSSGKQCKSRQQIFALL